MERLDIGILGSGGACDEVGSLLRAASCELRVLASQLSGTEQGAADG